MSSVSQFPPSHLIPDDREQSDAKMPQSEFPPLALPAPTDATMTGSSKLKESSDDQGDVFKFDHLGPIVINTDGTLSRVHNWESLTDAEKERTRRLLIQRNKARLEKLKMQEEE